MPISFDQLENLIIEWKNNSQNKSNHYDKVYQEGLRIRYLHLIQKVFEDLEIENVKYSETLNTDRTYGKLVKVNDLIISKL